jgi:uncharacterized protein (TIGR01370 family)
MKLVSSHKAAWLGKLCGVLAICSWLASCVAPMVPKPQRWAVFYGESNNWQQFQDLDLVVFDSDKHPPVQPLKAKGVKVLAYLSVAEIAPYRSFATQFSNRPDFIIGYQERWNSSVVDIRSMEWQRHILDIQIPAIMAKGFDGVMIDTLDSAFAKAGEDPIRFGGTQAAAIALIQQIRQKLPTGAIIMVNRGFEIADEIAPSIDVLLAESILVDANQQGVQYFPDEVYDSYVDRLQQLKQKNVHLTIFTLDYLNASDMNARQNIECVQRRRGFSPYISTVDLQQYHPSVQAHC